MVIMSDNQRSSVLAGVRVLEFTHAVLGPACGMVLSELGAEVIHIEPLTGDATRRLPGFGMGYFPYFNRGKKSLAVNLKTPEGIEVVHNLLRRPDGKINVLVENFGPGTMARLGLGYEALKDEYPELIYCELKGFLPGPYEKRTALDEVVQMMSGLAYMTGPEGQPLRAGASVIDVMTGMMGAIGVQAAIQELKETGKGQLVRSALFETAAFLMGHHMTYSAVTKTPVPPMPVRVSAWAIYNQFRTADDQLVFIGVTSDKQWLKFCDAFGQDEWAKDERLTTNSDRIKERDWFLPAVREMVAARDKADVLACCETAGIPFSPIARPEDLFEDDQLQQGGSLVDTLLPGGEAVGLPRLPVLFNDMDHAEQTIAAPQIGADTEEILAQSGYSPGDISSLAAKNIVALREISPTSGES
jgi:crotonobetainyl-CoA:carnitine CoA-transferase CaiB-like acyl-CoA transferase